MTSCANKLARVSFLWSSHWIQIHISNLESQILYEMVLSVREKDLMVILVDRLARVIAFETIAVCCLPNLNDDLDGPDHHSDVPFNSEIWCVKWDTFSRIGVTRLNLVGKHNTTHFLAQNYVKRAHRAQCKAHHGQCKLCTMVKTPPISDRMLTGRCHWFSQLIYHSYKQTCLSPSPFTPIVGPSAWRSASNAISLGPSSGRTKPARRLQCVLMMTTNGQMQSINASPKHNFSSSSAATGPTTSCDEK